MAMGRAVITMDVPGCRDTVIDAVNGFLIKPNDVVALAKAMERFISNPELIKKWVKKAEGWQNRNSMCGRRMKQF